MDGITHSLSQQSGTVLLIVLVLLASLAIATAVLLTRQSRFIRRWTTLMSGSTNDNLETLLYDHLRERLRIEQELESLRSRTSELEKKMLSSKRFVGLLRYDAFDDVAGNQSFALAMYDDNGNGAVITSLVGRVDCRVYCKPLVNGRSDRDLSQEEQRAMQDAISVAPKALVKN